MHETTGRLPQGGAAHHEDQEYSQQHVTVKPASPLRVVLLATALCASAVVFLALAYLHHAGQLGRHTEPAAGAGLLVLGLVTLLPGLYGMHLIWLVALGRETWESVPF